MLNLVPQPIPAQAPAPYAEALSRLASVRNALRLVEPSAGGPAGDSPDDAVADGWNRAAAPNRRLFDRRSARLVGASAAGVEALASQHEQGREPNPAASQALVDEIRRELRDIAGIVLA